MAESNQAPGAGGSASRSATATPSAESPPQAPTRSRLIDFARFEQDQARKVLAAREMFLERAERMEKEIPALFFRLAHALRDGVARYNKELAQAADLVGTLTYSDTPGVALGAIMPGAEYAVSVNRGPDRCSLRLRSMISNRGKDMAIIEGEVDVGRGFRAVIDIRIEGWIQDGATVFWVHLEQRRYPIDVMDLPDRILMAILRGTPQELIRGLEPPRRRRRDEETDGDPDADT